MNIIYRFVHLDSRFPRASALLTDVAISLVYLCLRFHEVCVFRLIAL